jgi:hypothetical protein
LSKAIRDEMKDEEETEKSEKAAKSKAVRAKAASDLASEFL